MHTRHVILKNDGSMVYGTMQTCRNINLHVVNTDSRLYGETFMNIYGYH